MGMRPTLSACWSCPNIVCRRFARSFSLRRESVKHEASVNAAPNPKIVCAGLVGSTVTSAAAAFLATFVHAISGPAASRLPLLSVISVCAGLIGACPSSTSATAFTGSPNVDAAAAPIPSPAYFKTSRRVVTLDSRLSLNHSRRLQPKLFALRDRILQNILSGTPLRPGKFECIDRMGALGVQIHNRDCQLLQHCWLQ